MLLGTPKQQNEAAVTEKRAALERVAFFIFILFLFSLFRVRARQVPFKA